MESRNPCHGVSRPRHTSAAGVTIIAVPTRTWCWLGRRRNPPESDTLGGFLLPWWAQRRCGNPTSRRRGSVVGVAQAYVCGVHRTLRRSHDSKHPETGDWWGGCPPPYVGLLDQAQGGGHLYLYLISPMPIAFLRRLRLNRFSGGFDVGSQATLTPYLVKTARASCQLGLRYELLACNRASSDVFLVNVARRLIRLVLATRFAE